jgi:hypothetical protein
MAGVNFRERRKMKLTRTMRGMIGQSAAGNRDFRFLRLMPATRVAVASVLLLLGSLAASDVHAATKTVRWSHPNVSNVSGFKIVVGPSSRAYDSTFNVGMPSAGSGTYEATVNLPDGRENYVAVVAYNIAGDSTPSNEAVVEESVVTLPPPETNTSFRINAGGPTALSAGGDTWTSDGSYVQSGTTRTTSASIGGTTADALYQTERSGGDYNAPMTYDFPVTSNGTYQVTLHWAETDSAASSPGARRFDVFIEDSLRLQNLDVVAEAGFQQAMSRILTTSVTDGSLTIGLQRLTDRTPFINAIAIELVPDGSGGPISPPVLIQVVPATP